VSEALEFHHRVSQFLFFEARLLDERRWNEWEALFLDDGVYWAPATPDQPNPFDHVSLIYEDQLLRKVRIARFASPAAPSLRPFPRTAHFVANVMIDRHDPETGVAAINSRFLMIEYRGDVRRFYGGVYHHEIVEDGGGFRIRVKRVDLVDCDGPHESSSIWF
jgi:benzoate/toluate 1,2-dioxygenase beta subunit